MCSVVVLLTVLPTYISLMSNAQFLTFPTDHTNWQLGILLHLTNWHNPWQSCWHSWFTGTSWLSKFPTTTQGWNEFVASGLSYPFALFFSAGVLRKRVMIYLCSFFNLITCSIDNFVTVHILHILLDYILLGDE